MRMLPLIASFLLTMALSGCGVFIPYVYDAGKLDRLSPSMARADAVKAIGKPDRVLADGANRYWEYRLFPKGEWKGYLVHCPWHPYCYFPGEGPSSYYVAWNDDRVCLWGTLFVVRHLSPRVCGGGTAGVDRMPAANEFSDISVVPVYMPPVITVPLHRLAVVRAGGEDSPQVTAWLDLTLNQLRAHHPDLRLVEREDLDAILKELQVQYSGRMDERTMVDVGKLAGADSVLLYRVAAGGGEAPSSASVDLRLVHVQTGMTLFRQAAIAAWEPTSRTTLSSWPGMPDVARRVMLDDAAAYAMAALMAAFGDNALGVVPDQQWTGEGVRVRGVLIGGPAHRAGVRSDDHLLQVDGRAAHPWKPSTDVPHRLTVDRHGATVTLDVEMS